MDIKNLLPKASSWAEGQAARGNDLGRALFLPESALARKIGVSHPEKIRIIIVETLPMPTDSALRSAAEQIGFLDGGMVGLTLGYSIFICRGHESSRLLSHEFRHVYQYEQAGSIGAFLSEYLLQIVELGYDASPFEIDAQAYECTDL